MNRQRPSSHGSIRCETRDCYQACASSPHRLSHKKQTFSVLFIGPSTTCSETFSFLSLSLSCSLCAAASQSTTEGISDCFGCISVLAKDRISRTYRKWRICSSRPLLPLLLLDRALIISKTAAIIGSPFSSAPKSGINFRLSYRRMTFFCGASLE